MYGRYSIKAFRFWMNHALLRGKPWRSVADVIWNQMESLGTKACTTDEIGVLFSYFSKVDIDKLIIIKMPAIFPQLFEQRQKPLAWPLLNLVFCRYS
jgi:hypothetical protein